MNVYFVIFINFIHTFEQLINMDTDSAICPQHSQSIKETENSKWFEILLIRLIFAHPLQSLIILSSAQVTLEYQCP